MGNKDDKGEGGLKPSAPLTESLRARQERVKVDQDKYMYLVSGLITEVKKTHDVL